MDGRKGNTQKTHTERGFVLSDHADWDGLNMAIKNTGAERVFVTHGYSEIFARWLTEQGYDAGVVKTEFTGDEEIDLQQENQVPI